MTEDTVRKVAENYSINKYSLLTGEGQISFSCVEDFIAGVGWERARSKKLLEALKYLEFYEKQYINSSPEEMTVYLRIIMDALKEYEGEK